MNTTELKQTICALACMNGNKLNHTPKGSQYSETANAVLAHLQEFTDISESDLLQAPLKTSWCVNDKGIGEVVRFRGSVSSLSEPMFITPPESGDDVDGLAGFTVIRATLDHNGSKVSCVPIVEEQIIRDLMENSQNPFWKFSGTVITHNGKFLFKIIYASPSTDLRDVVGKPSAKEVSEISSAIQDQGVSYIVDRFVEMKKYALVENGVFRTALAGVVLQAFSGPEDANAQLANAKMHIQCIGPSGAGKGRLHELAQAINPICEKMQSSKITVSGVIGATSQNNNGRKTEPGALARAHRGVVSLEDAHAMQNPSEIYDALSIQMEQGEVRINNCATATFKAQTGILFDQNRKSQVDPKVFGAEANSTKERLADLGIPLNIVNRIDLIFDLPLENSVSKVEAVFAGMNFDKTAFDQFFSSIKRYVAHAIDTIPCVILPKEVQDHASLLCKNVLANYGLDAVAGWGDITARTAQGFKKLILASARSRLSAEASRLDVERAVALLELKCEFLSRLDPSEDSPYSSTSDEYMEVMKRISDKFRDVEFKRAEAESFLRDTMGWSPKASTLNRYLVKFCTSTKYGFYKVRNYKPNRVELDMG